MGSPHSFGYVTHDQLSPAAKEAAAQLRARIGAICARLGVELAPQSQTEAIALPAETLGNAALAGIETPQQLSA